MTKDEIIAGVIAREGGYVNHPNDPGGETNYGITIKTARDFGYYGPMSSLPKAVAVTIYTQKYWYSVRGDDLHKISQKLCEEVVDTGINMGPRKSAEILQTAVAAVTGGFTTVDGVIGPATLEAVKKTISIVGEPALLKICNCLQGAEYVRIALEKPTSAVFLKGWINNRVTL